MRGTQSCCETPSRWDLIRRQQGNTWPHQLGVHRPLSIFIRNSEMFTQSQQTNELSLAVLSQRTLPVMRAEIKHRSQICWWVHLICKVALHRESKICKTPWLNPSCQSKPGQRGYSDAHMTTPARTAARVETLSGGARPTQLLVPLWFPCRAPFSVCAGIKRGRINSEFPGV